MYVWAFHTFVVAAYTTLTTRCGRLVGICYCFMFRRFRVKMSVPRPAILTEGFPCFPFALRAITEYYFKLGHCRFLPYLLHFFIL